MATRDGKSFFDDRDLVLKILKDGKENIHRRDKQKQSDNNVANEDATAVIQSVVSSWIEIFAKYNLTAEDFPKKTKMYREILRRYAGDEELLDIIGLSGWKYYRKTPLSVGDDAPDIGLISVDDGKKHLISELHQDKNKPLVILGSSKS
ncbi:uncharacterized protein LOC144433823 [Glandiceps talaboti]